MIKTGIIDPELTLRIVREAPLMAYDTETSGLTIRDFICGYVVTNWEVSTYVPVRHEAGGNIPNPSDFEAALAEAFMERTRLGHRTVGHHLGFDLRASLRHGVRITGPCEDTQINESLINDRTIGYSLDECAARRGVTAKKGDIMYRAIAARFGGLPDKKSMANFWRMPGDQFETLDYATGDGVTTLELWQVQQGILDEEELRVPWQLECDLLPYVARMHHRGMKIDHNYAEIARKKVSEDVEEAKAKFSPGFNVRSSSEILELYRQNGYEDDQFAYTEPTAKHPKGQVSFREKWLQKNEIGKAILTVRQLDKADSSFIRPLVETQNLNGRIHPVLHQSKSDTFGVAGARFSCSDPNMQAQPKRNKIIGKIVRPHVIPDDGMLIEEADAMQQEPRFFTHYSQDPALLEGYRNGTLDIHDRSSEVLGLDRDYAKRLGLGMLTMMSPPTLAMHMDYSIDEARRDHKAFLTEAFPRIKEFQDLAVGVYKKRGFVKSILGRKARCEDPRFAYQAVSRIIQNGGGDHLKTCLLRACQYEDVYPDAVQMLLTIHDSLLWQRDPGHMPHELVRIVENVPHEPQFSLSVPIPFEVGSGHHWGEASYGDKIKDKKGWVGDYATAT